MPSARATIAVVPIEFRRRADERSRRTTRRRSTTTRSPRLLRAIASRSRARKPASVETRCRNLSRADPARGCNRVQPDKFWTAPQPRVAPTDPLPIARSLGQRILSPSVTGVALHSAPPPSRLRRRRQSEMRKLFSRSLFTIDPTTNGHKWTLIEGGLHKRKRRKRSSFAAFVVLCFRVRVYWCEFVVTPIRCQLLKLVRFPVSLAPTLVALPSMSRFPRVPFSFQNFRGPLSLTA